MKSGHLLVGLLGLAVASHGVAQSWTQQKNIEIVVGSAPGGSNDKTARTVERVLSANKLVSTPVSVLNKPGGGSTIAFTYVHQHAGDAHWPFAFELRQRYVLTPAALEVHLAFTNRAAQPQPVGLGWHPY
ncbi:MAG: hypothetical protein Q8L40_11820, partial [Burkholderiales bacterium]|nr:hypothetical protein [Burkholderiales bacterium]